MSKSKFDVTETAKKFISDIKKPEIKDEKSRGKKRETGEKTTQVGFYITDEQNMNVAMAAIKMKKDKSSVVREALNLYMKKLKEEGIL